MTIWDFFVNGDWTAFVKMFMTMFMGSVFLCSIFNNWKGRKW